VITNDRVIAVVPARGGSKKVPGKNLRPLAGRPLLQWSIDVARQVPEIDRVIVSTDDDAIGRVGRQAGAEVYQRPPHLATDSSLVIDALRDLASRLAAEGEQASVMVLLEPTCPLRTPADVRAVLQLLDRERLDSAATFTDASLNPHRAWRIENNRPDVFVKGAVPWLPRQSLPEAYQLNGAVYAFRVPLLAVTEVAILGGSMGAVIMPKERSVDIDDEMDFAIAELIIERTQNVKDRV
jgi:N-acylneuraminate cytidylyltransferase